MRSYACTCNIYKHFQTNCITNYKHAAVICVRTYIDANFTRKLVLAGKYYCE